MEKFVSHKGLAVSLAIKDIDTDLIIPAEFLTSTTRGGYGANLFRRLRDNQSDFFLNRPEFVGASVLVADNNFGCGSSREHAVWALKEAGFKAVIAKSFADIFRSNSSKNGLVLITLATEQVNFLLKQASQPGYLIEVNLETEQVVCPDSTIFSFNYDPFVRHCLLNGVDELDFILESKDGIEKYWTSRESRRYYRTV